MAARKKPAFISRLKTALEEDLAGLGIKARVTTEAIPGTKLHRVTVVAPKFGKLRYSERQELVWRIVDKVIDKDQQLHVTMIYTLAPSEESGRSAA